MVSSSIEALKIHRSSQIQLQNMIMSAFCFNKHFSVKPSHRRAAKLLIKTKDRNQILQHSETHVHF